MIRASDHWGRQIASCSWYYGTPAQRDELIRHKLEVYDRFGLEAWRVNTEGVANEHPFWYDGKWHEGAWMKEPRVGYAPYATFVRKTP